LYLATIDLAQDVVYCTCATLVFPGDAEVAGGSILETSMHVTQVAVAVVEVPQRAPLAPYRSHLRTSSTTQSAIIRVDTSEGITGWGEHNVIDCTIPVIGPSPEPEADFLTNG
jgi:hypothetical protein